MQVADTHNYVTGDGTIHHNSGKTHFGVRWCLQRMRRNMGSSSRKGAIIAPTLRHLKYHHLAATKEALATIGFREKFHYTYDGQYNVLKFIKATTGFDYQIFFVTMENWKALVAWEFDWAWWDEPGFGSLELYEFVNQRVGRSPGVEVGQILFTGVVQFPNWYYETFGAAADLQVTSSYRLQDAVKKGRVVNDFTPGNDYGGMQLERFRENDKHLVLHGSTFENPELQDNYLRRLWDTHGYHQTKFLAQVIGKAIVVNSRAVYPEFSEASSVVNEAPFDPKRVQVLNLCFDFNYGQMTALVCVAWQGSYYAIWENSFDCQTTEEACKEFIRAFPPEYFGNHFIHVFGDHGGYGRTTQVKTQEGDYSIIKQQLLKHYVNLKIKAKRHPFEQGYRVLSTNRFLAGAKDGTRALYILRACRKLISSLRNASWDPKTGKIKKGSEDTDTHAAEALDYCLVVEEPPVETPRVITTSIAENGPIRRSTAEAYPRGRTKTRL